MCCSVPHLIEDNTGLCLYSFLLLLVYLYLTTCVCFYIYIGGALKWTIYMTLIGYTIYNRLGILVSACPIINYAHNMCCSISSCI